jgi:hypothetical protein
MRMFGLITTPKSYLDDLINNLEYPNSNVMYKLEIYLMESK